MPDTPTGSNSMTILQNTGFRIAVGTAAVVLAAAAIGAGTYAAFSDPRPARTEPSPAARLTWSLPGALTSKLTTVGADVTCTEPEYVAEGVAANACNPAGNLQEQMTVAVVAGPNGAVAAAPLSQFLTTGLPLPGTLAAGATTYTLRFTLPDLSGTTKNKVQGDSITITSTFDLVQT
jgi:hypothetical protein